MPKQTAKNNELLRKAKRAVGTGAYREASRLLNEVGEWRAREYLSEVMPRTLDELLDAIGDLHDNLKGWSG